MIAANFANVACNKLLQFVIGENRSLARIMDGRKLKNINDEIKSITSSIFMNTSSSRDYVSITFNIQ